MKKQLPILVLAVLLTAGNLCAQLTAVVNQTNPTCGGSNGSATVVPSGGAGYTYKWSTGSQTNTASGLSAGTYHVTVYSSSGGVNWDTLYYQTFDSSVQTWNTNISTGTNESLNNYWDVSDSCVGNGVIGTCVNNTYSPAAGANKCLYITAQDNGLGLGQYAGARYDAGGQGFCSAIGICTQTNLAAQSPNINTVGAHNLVLSFQYTAGGGGLIDNASLFYSINGGTSFVSLDPSLKSVNSSSCMADGDLEGTWAYVTYNLPSICNNINNLVIRFNWTNDGQGDAPNLNDPSIAVDNLSIRDSIPVSGSDSIIKTVTLTSVAGPQIVTTSLVITNPACGQTNGSITGIGASGGTTPYTITWTNSSNVVIGNSYPLTSISAGSYTFEVTDLNGCTADSTFIVNPSGSANPPTITSNRQTICSTDSAQICAPSGYLHYVWNGGDTTQCVTGKLEGNYYVTVTDNTHCTAESNHFNLIVYPQPSVSISQNGDTLSVYNQVSYQWYLGNNLISGATSHIYIANQSGSYSVLVTDTNGCASKSSAVIISVDINEVASNKTFEIYPNPVSSGSLQLRITAELLGNEMTIFDAEGRVVYKAKITELKTEINVEKLAKGNYVIKAGAAVRKFVRE